MRRLFDYNPTLGITRYFHYNEATGQSTITTHQDVGKIAEEATRKRNMHTSLDRWGDGAVIASVPLSIYHQWVREGKERDDAFLRRWLNDPDNKVFRTRPGKV